MYSIDIFTLEYLLSIIPYELVIPREFLRTVRTDPSLFPNVVRAIKAETLAHMRGDKMAFVDDEILSQVDREMKWCCTPDFDIEPFTQANILSVIPKERIISREELCPIGNSRWTFHWVLMTLKTETVGHASGKITAFMEEVPLLETEDEDIYPRSILDVAAFAEPVSLD